MRQGTSKYVTVTLDTDEERINVPQLYTNLQLEEKAGSFNATQVSRISTKHQTFSLEAR